MIDTIMTWVISVGGIILTLGVVWMLGCIADSDPA